MKAFVAPRLGRMLGDKMLTRTIHLLHVEDDEFQRLVVSRYLRSLEEFTFAVSWADSEETAMGAFQAGGVDCVILDHHLTSGNGLNCLRRMRALDPIVPIVALSAAASTELAAELVRSGADDYINKQELTRKKFTQTVRSALLRAEACRLPAVASLDKPADHPGRPCELEQYG
jgi:DNA-binding response OmpR family regulator